ncbi:MAG: hypothetical protein AAGD05_09845 [Bacteroidota bacterium]
MNSIQQLKKVLMANAIFSASSGLLLIIARTSIAQLMGITQPLTLLGIGVGLLLFALSVFWESRRTTIQKKNVQWIIIQDWLWVIGSTGILLFQAFSLTGLAYALIFGVALIVASFAILQHQHLRSMQGEAE